MLWHLDNPDAAARRKAIEEKGRTIPERLWPPDVWPGAELWLEAFWELGTERQIGMAVGPIPASAIRAYTAGWPEDEAERFRLVIRRLDAAYLGRSDPDVDPAAKGSDNPARDKFRAAMGR